jgi:hypothetical protein
MQVTFICEVPGWNPRMGMASQTESLNLWLFSNALQLLWFLALNIRMIMWLIDWKGHGWKWSQAIVLPQNFPGETEENCINPQYNHFPPDWNLYLQSPWYKAEVPVTWPWHSFVLTEVFYYIHIRHSPSFPYSNFILYSIRI